MSIDKDDYTHVVAVLYATATCVCDGLQLLDEDGAIIHMDKESYEEIARTLEGLDQIINK